MQTFDQELLAHVTEGRISEEVADETASSPHDFKLMLAAGGQRASGIEQLSAPLKVPRRAPGWLARGKDARPHPPNARESPSVRAGIALPMAMLATVIGLALASVPILASIDTQRGDRRNQSSDAAFTAADSGAELAVQRQTQMASLLTTSKPCVKKNGTKLEAVATEDRRLVSARPHHRHRNGRQRRVQLPRPTDHQRDRGGLHRRLDRRGAPRSIAACC